MSGGQDHSIQSFNDAESVDNTSTYDMIQLMSRPDLRSEPIKFVNANSLKQE